MTRLGERRLGTADGLAEALAIGPVVSVGFASYLVAAYAGGATPITITIAFAGALALGWVFSQFARRYAGAGTVYEYLTSAGPRALGIIASGAYFLVALLGAAGGLLSGLLIENFCATRLGFEPSWWSGGALTLLLVAVLLHVGVRISTRAILLLSVAAAIPMIVLTVAILVKGGANGLTATPFDPTRGDVPRALLYAVLLFAGFEAAACLGEESAEPHRSIPRAMRMAIVACGVFYVIVLYAVTVAFGVDRAATAWGSDPLAVISLGDKWVGHPLSALIQAGVIVDLTAFLLAIFNVAARGYFTLAREGLLPPALARTSTRGTPLGGIILIITANIVVMLVAIPFRDRYQVFAATVSAGPIVSLTVYLLLCGLALKLISRGRGPWWGYIVVGAGAAVPGLGLYGSFVPFPTGARLVGLLLAAASALAAATAFAWLKVRRPETIERAVRHVLLASDAEHR